MKYRIIPSGLKEDHWNYCLVDEEGHRTITGTKSAVLFPYLFWNDMFEDEPMLPLDSISEAEQLIEKYDYLF